MRAAKILAGILIGLVVLIAVALLAVRFLVNPNDYKARIAAAVRESTGRELLLPGDIKLSVFPWIALELGPASLGNPPNFDHEPFLAFQHAALRVKLMPLIHHQLEIGRIELDGLDMRLKRNAAGQGNWEMPSDKDKPSEKPDKGGYGESLKNIAGLRITNGRVSYQDILIDRIDIETGEFTNHGVIPISVNLNANYGGPEKTVTLSAKLSLSVDQASEQVRLAGVSLSGLASHPGSNRPSHWELTAPAIDANFAKQTLALPSFAASYLGAQVTGKISATKIVDDPSATGSLKLDPLSLREFLPRLGIAIPRVHDSRALASIAASSEFDYNSKGVKLENIQVTLDDTHLHGTVTLVSTEQASRAGSTAARERADAEGGRDGVTASSAKAAEVAGATTFREPTADERRTEAAAGQAGPVGAPSTDGAAGVGHVSGAAKATHPQPEASKAANAGRANAKVVTKAASEAMKSAKAGAGAGNTASKALSAATAEADRAAGAKHEESASSVKFDLGVDAIDLNRYLSDSNGAAAAADEAKAKSAESKPETKPEKPMDADGILTIGNVKLSTFELTSVRLTLASHDGVIRLAPTQALIDGGRYAGDITLDERPAVPLISMDEHLTGVDISRLLAQGSLKGRVSGHGNVNIKATAKGMDADSVFKTLSGSFDASLAEGALEGIDLGYAIAQAQSLIEHQNLASAQNAGRTKFDAFKMSAQITNGIATTKDVNISSAVLKITGGGNINLPTKAIDMDLVAALMKAPKSTAAEIPMKITGTYTDPTVRPDVEALAKGALKQKLQDTLGDKLKQLLGKP